MSSLEYNNVDRTEWWTHYREDQRTALMSRGLKEVGKSEEGGQLWT